MALSALVTLSACEKPETNPYAQKSAAPAATTAPPAATQAPTNEMKDLIVDELGPFVGGERPKLTETGGPEKLKRLIGELPLKEQKEVSVAILKKAKMPDVVAVVRELTAAGVAKIKLKTDGRADLPKEISVTAQREVADAAKCSVVAMVREDLSTAVWTLAGGTARNHRKGFAGPDLSHTSQTLEKEFPKCKSSVAFFSADDSLLWEHAHNLAGTLLAADKEKQIDTLVLLESTPVAGREVSLGASP